MWFATAPRVFCLGSKVRSVTGTGQIRRTGRIRLARRVRSGQLTGQASCQVGSGDRSGRSDDRTCQVIGQISWR
eukprot:3345622-Karenia_brevis.AAC.1